MKLLSAVSQVLNVIFLNGHPNESISGRAYREGWIMTMTVINTIFFWQNNHCRSAHHADVAWAREFAKYTQ